jgi:uncharacterized surface protein with fasciclin (FAS1) repeats
MKTNYLTPLAKKLIVTTGIIGVMAFLGILVMAQTRPGTTQPAKTQATPSTTGAPAGQTRENLLQVAQSNSTFSTLVQALQTAGLSDTLTKGNYTIFAPTNQAFKTSLPGGAVEFLLKPENKDLLRQVLLYHVVPGKVTAKNLKTGLLKTLGGGVAVRVNGKQIIVNDANVTQADINASNGVIHTINRVLLPRKLREKIINQLSKPTPNPTP